jgi:beta-barrel assembly-enhancing protease
MLLSFSAGCSCSRPWLITEGIEREIGEYADQNVRAEMPEYQGDPRVGAFVSALGQRLVTASDRPDLEFNFAVLDSEEINAFALPGGFVYVTTGLLRRVENGAELAGVLGHEIGHVTGRHGAKRVELSVGAGILISLLFGGGDLEWIADKAVTLVLNTSYSQADELDADRRGIGYARQAGYDPRGILQFFEELKSIEGDRSRLEKMLATHPPAETRISQGRAVLEELGLPVEGAAPGASGAEEWAPIRALLEPPPPK